MLCKYLPRPLYNSRPRNNTNISISSVQALQLLLHSERLDGVGVVPRVDDDADADGDVVLVELLGVVAAAVAAVQAGDYPETELNTKLELFCFLTSHC
jgi:hypothetical protein